MKKFFSLLFTVAVVGVLAFFGAGCTPKGFDDNPKTDDIVISNGGTVVQKGDYLYFANGVAEVDSATSDNILGAIYRVKLNGGQVALDEDGYVVGAERVVGRVVGFPSGGMHIYGDYIYYVTPNLGVNYEGDELNEQIELRRININGTDDKSIYQASTTSTEVKWDMAAVNGTVYFVNLDSDELVLVNASNGDQKTIAHGVSTFVVDSRADYRAQDTFGENHNLIYYTRTATEDEMKDDTTLLGNLLCSAKLSDGEEKIIDSSDSEYKVIEMDDVRLIYENDGMIYERTSSRNRPILGFATYNKAILDNDQLYINTSTDLLIINLHNSTTVSSEYADCDTVNTLLMVRGNDIYYVNNTSVYRYKNSADRNQRSSTLLFGGDEDKFDMEKLYFDTTGFYVTAAEKITGEDDTERSFLARYDITNPSDIEHLAIFGEKMKPEEHN